MTIKTLRKRYPGYFYFLLVVTSMVSSIMSVALLALINNTINGTKFLVENNQAWVLYIALIAASFLVKRYFQTKMLDISREIMFEMIMELLRQIKKVSLRQFEKLEQNRVYTAFQDIAALQAAPTNFIAMINSIAIFVSCFSYLVYISAAGSVIILGTLAILAFIYYFRNINIEKDMTELREKENEFYLYLSDMLKGYKELKMDPGAEEKLVEDLIKNNRETVRNKGFKVGIRYMNNDLLGDYFWYILIGVALYTLPGMVELNQKQLAVFVITLLYLIEPTNSLINLIPKFTSIKIADYRLNELQKELNTELNVNAAPPDWLSGPFESLRFENVCFTYSDKNNEMGFSVGPISFEILRGEIVFFTGGNGSGKSTILKIASGLYYPTSGEIFYNGHNLEHEHLIYFRKMISVTFPEGYLFSENYHGFEFEKEEDRVAKLLKLLDISDKTQFKKKENWFDHRFSTGQRKRMALFYELMKNKEILFLDEWAAEQDPKFRGYFYQEIVPRLNKDHTIIMVSHDSDYIPSKSRIIRFKFGKIEEQGVSHNMTGIP